MNPTISLTYKWARRIAVSLLGGTVLLVGVCMIVLPGPAIVVIPLGLAILSLEFAWARHWLRKIRAQAQQHMPGRKPDVAEPVAPAKESVSPASEPVGGVVQPASGAQRAAGSTRARNSSYERTP